MEVNSQSYTEAVLPPGQRLTVPTEQELHGAHSQYGRYSETRKLLPLLEFECRIVQPANWSLHRLHYP